MTPTMQAAVYVEPTRIVLEDRPLPQVGYGDALIRVTITTICGTDIHILKGEYPVERGRIVGHEPVGIIEELGPGVTGFELGQGVIVGAITPCGQCNACLSATWSQCGGTPLGGWRLGNTMDGCQAEYVRVPFAMANLTPVPSALTDDITHAGHAHGHEARSAQPLRHARPHSEAHPCIHDRVGHAAVDQSQFRHAGDLGVACRAGIDRCGRTGLSTSRGRYGCG